MSPIGYAITIVSAYLLGSFNTAIVLSKIKKSDIRTLGSGNAGLTNAQRVFGLKFTVAVLVGDVLKGVIGAMIGSHFGGQWGKLIAGIFLVFGHVFPVYFRFKGGKGVLVGVAMMFVFDYRCGLIAMACFFLAVLLTRYVSLGSVCGAVSVPFSVSYFYYPEWKYALLSSALIVYVIFLHRGNIRRIVQKTERKISFGKREGDK